MFGLEMQGINRNIIGYESRWSDLKTRFTQLRPAGQSSGPGVCLRDEEDAKLVPVVDATQLFFPRCCIGC